ncbi:MAG: hypothetical protein ACK46Q_05580 [Hyphomonas sp.]
MELQAVNLNGWWASTTVTPNVVMPDARSKTGYKVEATGWRGFKAARAMDIFDDLDRRERARAEREQRDPRPVFSRAQVDIARRYRNLVERHDAGGMKCASLEGRGGGGPSSGGEFIDAFVAEGDEIRQLQRRIGTGAAMVVRRVRPSARGGLGASIIRDRDLVDAICLHGRSFREVLGAHGWAVKGQNITLMMQAFSACLERMQSGRDSCGKILS